jgi:hypothetical protein
VFRDGEMLWAMPMDDNRVELTFGVLFLDSIEEMVSVVGVGVG